MVRSWCSLIVDSMYWTSSSTRIVLLIAARGGQNREQFFFGVECFQPAESVFMQRAESFFLQSAVAGMNFPIFTHNSLIHVVQLTCPSPGFKAIQQKKLLNFSVKIKIVLSDFLVDAVPLEEASRRLHHLRQCMGTNKLNSHIVQTPSK